LGDSKFCGSWKLYRPDGTPLPRDECPMAMALQQKRLVRGVEAVAERPDGMRIPFISHPTPLFDASGRVTGAVNMLVDISERKQAKRREVLAGRRMREICMSGSMKRRWPSAKRSWLHLSSMPRQRLSCSIARCATLRSRADSLSTTFHPAHSS